MKKIPLKILGIIFSCFAFVLMIPEKSGCVQAEVKTEYMQDVLLDAAHFPDERFRMQLARYVDTDKDGILTAQEREKIYYVEFGNGSGLTKGWYLDMMYRGVEENDVLSKDKFTLELS